MLLLAGVLNPINAALGAPGLSLIRDTEIENTIRAYSAPLLQAAGLETDAFNIHLVRDDKLNAFVAGGQRIFITTGLLRRSGHAGQVLGVIAHEIGHITGGHLARTHDMMAKAGTVALITQILGVAVGLLARDASAVAAIGGGGQSIAERSFMAFSRGQEQAADQAGIRYLDKLGYSSRGIAEFLRILSGQELLRSSRQDPYLRTHPITSERVRFVENHVKNSPYSDRPTSPAFAIAHQRMVAKLDGFIDPPETTLARYKADDRSVGARYARTIAEFRRGNLDAAIPMIEALIREYPDDAYFVELKGQMLFENGRLEKALDVYKKAVSLLPNAPLFRTSLAHVIIELNRPELLETALSHVKSALRIDRFNPLAWRLAGIAHGRRGEMGLSAWSLAEYNLLAGRKDQAFSLARRAMTLLKEGSPSWLRAQDIANQKKSEK
jgi:predicted Zn-dependent protease